MRAAVAEFEAKGLKPRDVSPPICRLLWRLGVPVAPFPFWGYWARAARWTLMSALWFGAIYVPLRLLRGLPLDWVKLLLGPCACGFVMAAAWPRPRGVPPWRDCEPQVTAPPP